MKTKTFILAALIPVALALTGCSQHEPEGTPPPATNAASEKPAMPAEPPAMTPPPPPPAPAPAPAPVPPVPDANTNPPATTNQ